MRALTEKHAPRREFLRASGTALALSLVDLVMPWQSLSLAADDRGTAAKYRAPADKLIDAALNDIAGLNRLEFLCYRIGNRLSGSQALDQAIAWATQEMRNVGLSNVRTIPVTVPHWVRGRESAEVVDPLQAALAILGLGGSVATPPEGITAEVVVVSGLEELEKLGTNSISGKIVLYDAPLIASDKHSYEEARKVRVSGASRAARLGAVAALVRSITSRSLRDPHTGAMVYVESDPKIPTASVSIEDAIWLHRLTQSGQRVRIHLAMEAHTAPDVESADVMGEIVGREKPDEVVVMGGHIDSWDVGMGAQDDGSGVMAALEAVALIKKLRLQPRRTIRVVFWTNEENGGKGGLEYRAWARKQAGQHIAAIEMDGGAEKPEGFDVVGARPELLRRLSAIGHLLKRIDAAKIEIEQPDSAEADIEPLLADGVPALGLRTVGTHYLDFHHTQADTFDKIVPAEFKLCTAAVAVMGYVLADWP